MAVPEIAAGVVGPQADGVTAVRNWNAAAERATGELLFVIADDLLPPPGWDFTLVRLLDNRNPTSEAFVVKVKDSPADESMLLRHPVVSRRYYERYGLWHPAYQGHFVDDDFTLSAQRRRAVVDGRELVLDHRHWVHGAERTDSQARMQTSHAAGQAVFARRWPAWKQVLARHGWVRLVKVTLRRALR